MPFSQVSCKSEINFDNTIKNITEYLKDKSPKKLLVLNASLKINSVIYDVIGADRFSCFFKNIDFELYRYFIYILKSFDMELSNKLLMKFENQYLHSLIDFINCVKHYRLSTYEDLDVMSSVIVKIGCGQSLDNLLARSNYYVKHILGKSAFDEEAKVKAILNATKPTVHINCIKHNNSFFNADAIGQATSCENDVSDEPPMLGLFYKDLQYIDNLEVDVISEGKHLKCKKYASDYSEDSSFEDIEFSDNISIQRNRDIKDNFKEETTIKNTSDKKAKVIVKINVLGADIFETRAKIKCEEKEIEVQEYKNHLLYKIKFPHIEPYNLDISLEDEKSCIKPHLIDKTFIRYTFYVEPNSSKKVNLRMIYKEQDIYEKTKENVKIPLKDFSHLGDVQNQVVQKASKDLNKLISSVVINNQKLYYVSAGIPRYCSLFGRDSLITAMMINGIQPNLARDTIKILAHYQGMKFEDRFKKELEMLDNSCFPTFSKVSAINGLKELYIKREEEEGKIIHELRLGPLTQIAKTPHSPYYGSVDATPLWLMLASDYFLNTNDTMFYEEILPCVEKAISWILNNISEGYLRFSGASLSCDVQIKNQGWKDADDSLKHILGEDGKLKDPCYPVALAEVQGYIYKAFKLTSKAFEKIGKETKASELLDFAKSLKERFNRDFWCDQIGFYSMGLDSNNEKIRSITSNVGHCLYSGIIDKDKRILVENRLMSYEMFSGVGIRTLSVSSEAFDSLSYHNGSVWPHDSAICALKMCNENMRKLFDGLCHAAYKLPNRTIPEVIAGNTYDYNDIIECYPDTCSPQGWSSAGIIGMALKLT